LRDIEYEGVVGLEAFPRADDIDALERFRHYFSAPDQAGSLKTRV
jgi:hydroxypyruvate isomerase